MKKRILFLTILLLMAMVFTSVLLADSGPVGHLIDRNGRGGCSETATVTGSSIPDNLPAGVCWNLTMGGAGTTVADVSVDVAATHTWVGDLEFWLSSPDGSTLYMMDRPGVAGQAGPCCGDSTNLASASPLSFYDTAPTSAESMGSTIGDTQVVCQDDGQCDFSPAPDGAAGLPNFAGFAGETTDGTWSFCAADNAGLDTGSVANVTVNVSCNAPAMPAIAMTKTVGTDPNACATSSNLTIDAGGGGTDVTYCYYVTNTGNITLSLHTVSDDQLGDVLGPDANQPLGPNDSYWFTTTTLITETTVNVATWTAVDSNGTYSATATSTATVTQGAPTDVSLSSFGTDQTSITPIWLATLLAVILGFGLLLRRRMDSGK